MRDVAFSNDKIVKSTVLKTRLLWVLPRRIDKIKRRKSFSGWDYDVISYVILVQVVVI